VRRAHREAVITGSINQQRRGKVRGETLAGCAFNSPPVAMATATATSPHSIFSAAATRSSAAIFGVSFNPRAKLTAPVVSVAHEMAVRYPHVRLPNNDATPLKLSLAPLE